MMRRASVLMAFLTGASVASAQVPPSGTTPATPARKAAAAPVKKASRVSFEREVFAYVGMGRRDPFASPIETGELRPLLSDLRLVGIIYDAAEDPEGLGMRSAT